MQIDASQLAEMATFYHRAFGYRVNELGEARLYLAGGQRQGSCWAWVAGNTGAGKIVSQRQSA
ncbi:MAG: hypothetical protein ACHQZQ_04300 [SAR324 cluster bacterium]